MNDVMNQLKPTRERVFARTPATPYQCLANQYDEDNDVHHVEFRQGESHFVIDVPPPASMFVVGEDYNVEVAVEYEESTE